MDGRDRADRGLRNHGQRVSAMVALAKSWATPRPVGALQGNFGTPFENDLAGTVAELEAARAASAASPGDADLQAEVARLEAELAAAPADCPGAPPRVGPSSIST